ncbi:MAG TPA: carboxymuconolactone decarboxylase family protein [Jiangellaceae bacterium]|nr:carboxymuconolactone decarboxylase family protein [Jiangellaceae bacterium]
MARISLTPPRTVFSRFVGWYSRRRYGAVMEPSLAMGHHTGVLLTLGSMEMAVLRWTALDPALKELAVMASSSRIGCSWCMDFGYWEGVNAGVDPAKLRDVPTWRDSDRYTDLERRVMAYAEAMTTLPLEVTDEMVEQLVQDLGERAFVELTAIVAVENQRSRFNSALGLSSQGFKDRCEVPAL